ncbi:MAG TPA: MarR family transcriptional regulator [Acidimicrobiales bacterium]|nr:MarR family transcriptional regulator [Acidimicrobiales bacterium]
MHHIVDDPDDAVAQIERALVAIRRSQRRRPLGGPALAGIDEALGEPLSLGVLGVIDAVQDVPADGEVTVGLVAERLGLDPSRASRLVAEAVDRRLVDRLSSTLDGRRIRLELTDQGQQVFARVQAVRRTYVAERLTDWSPHERRTFARLLHRFTTDQP